MTLTIVETTHQGVQTVLAPRAGSNIAAGLVFRVGRADESLPVSGITHLIEHLALHAHGSSDLRFNGATEMGLTHFHVEGSEADIVRYLNGVCAALTELPLERLETEKRILQTESNTRGALSTHFMTRHGALGYGLASIGELGLANLTEEQVGAWAARWFTRQNAVLWITSDAIPAGLRLSLVEGLRIPPPVPTNVLTDRPAWYPDGGQVTSLDAIVERSTAANLFTAILGKRLFHEVRQEAGLSYDVGAVYAPLNRDEARITATADTAPEWLGAVAGGFVDTLAGLRHGTIEQSELDAAKESALRALEDPDLEARILPAYAANLLLDHPNLSTSELAEEVRAVTTEDLRRVAARVWEDALIRTPSGDLSWCGATQVAQSNVAESDGTEYPSLAFDGSALFIAADGVTMERADWRSKVRYEDAVGVLRWPDGARVLVGSDGFTVRIEPTMYSLGVEELSAIDASTAADVSIDMPMRQPADIPRPPTLAPVPVPGLALTRTERAGARIAATVLYVMGAFILSVVVISELSPQTRGQDTGNVIGATALGLVCLGMAMRLNRRTRSG